MRPCIGPWGTGEGIRPRRRVGAAVAQRPRATRGGFPPDLLLDALVGVAQAGSRHPDRAGRTRLRAQWRGVGRRGGISGLERGDQRIGRSRHLRPARARGQPQHAKRIVYDARRRHRGRGARRMCCIEVAHGGEATTPRGGSMFPSSPREKPVKARSRSLGVRLVGLTTRRSVRYLPRRPRGRCEASAGRGRHERRGRRGRGARLP